MFCTVFSESDERERFKRIYLRYHRDVFAKTFSLLGNHHDAEDAAQEAWTAIAKNMASLPEENSDALKGTILMIAKYKAIDLFRSRCRKDDMTVEMDAIDFEMPIDDTVFSEICEKETAETLFACMKEMDEKYTDILRLYYLQGNSTRKIAKLLSMRVKTVETRLSRGRAILCKKLKEKGYAGA